MEDSMAGNSKNCIVREAEHKCDISSHKKLFLLYMKKKSVVLIPLV
jgi:hypothetical protein